MKRKLSITAACNAANQCVGKPVKFSQTSWQVIYREPDKATAVMFYKKHDETVQEVMHFRESRCSKFVYCPETNKLVCK